MVGITFERASTFLEFVANQRLVTKRKEEIASTWSGDSTPNDERKLKGIKINLTVDFRVPVSLLSKLVEALVANSESR